MGDLFLSKLPVGHAICTMTRAAASASLAQEPAFGAAVAPTVDEARRQCAAMAWLLSDVYSQPAVAKLAQPARLYLLKLCGLDATQRGAAAQAASLHTHLAAHHRSMIILASPTKATPVLVTAAAAATAVAAAAVATAAARGPGQAPGDDTGGFAPALLAPQQLAALLALPCVEIKKVLDAAGVPYGAGIAHSDVRSKGAAAAWGAEKLRSPEDIGALPDGVQDRLLTCFDMPPAWRPEARRHSLSVLLQACRDSAWALDPGLIFRPCQPATLRALPPYRATFDKTTSFDDHPGPGPVCGRAGSATC
jgi:hypothetical protein